MTASQYFPFLRWRRIVNKETLGHDFVAALTGTALMLPQGVAFAIIAGLPPQYGLYAGMLPAIIAALFGSSWHLVSGPTTAASVILFSILSARALPGTAEYIQFAITLTFMVGVIQLGLGFVRLGSLVDFVSHSVLVGFTAGAAALIFASQLKHFLGISLASQDHAYQTLITAVEHLAQANPYAVSIGLITIIGGVLSRYIFPKVPYMLVAFAVGTVAALALEFSAQSPLGLKYVSAVPASLPPLSFPKLNFDSIRELAPAALALTLFALTEAVGIARSLAIKSGQHLDGNQEFVGQGLSNIVGSFFSSYVATGSFNRSALNYQSGARTPVAALLGGVLLMLVVPFVGPYLAYLPMPAVAGILFLVAWNLIDLPHIRKILRASNNEALVMAITFFTAIFVDLEFAILLGVLMSLFFFLLDATRPRIYSRVPDPDTERRNFVTDPTLPECPQIKIVRVDGSFFFGAVHHLQKMFNIFSLRQAQQNHMLLIAFAINRIDVSGAEFLAQEAQKRRAEGGQLYLYRPKTQVTELLKRGGYADVIPPENIFRSKGAAIAHMVSQVDREICKTCDKRIFLECEAFPKASNETV
ncbi:MAG: SulP family inorganic anion transporter [Pseudomonadota bacterium]